MEWLASLTFPHFPGLAHLSRYPAQVRKIGEGTFGEAFKASGQVLKIVPMEGDIKVRH